MDKEVRIKRVIDYTIPMFGNRRLFPYYTLEVTDGDLTKVVKTKEDGSNVYFTFKRKRYYVYNEGRLYNPKPVIKTFAIS